MGQICKPILDVDTASLNYELTTNTLGKNYFFRQFFPLKEVSRFTVKTIEGGDDIPVAARRVSFNAKNPLFTRKTVGKNELKLGKYAASRDMDEIQIQEYRDLKAIASASNNPAAANEMVDIAYNDVRFCERAIPAKIEADALGIASLGKQTFNSQYEGDMVTEDEIDFNVPASNFGGVTVAWSDEKNADGLADLMAWQDKIASTGEEAPKYAIMEKKAFRQLCAQEKTAKRLFPASKVLDVFSTGMVDLTAINNYMDGKGYPHILVIDSWVGFEDLEGHVTRIKPWNENVVTLAPTTQLGYTYWKRKHIEEAEDKVSIESQGEFYNVTIIGERNPDKVTTSAEAYAQVGLINRRSTVFMNTTKSEWNEGK